MKTHNVTLIPGDGVGPEVVESTRAIIEASGVKILWEVRKAGASVFREGVESGVPQDTIDSIKKNRVVFKGPLETPVGFGEKSANVTLRKLFETFANVRPVSEYKGVVTPYSGRNLDIVIVRENVEDLYAGIEHMQTPEVAQCLKIITRPGCEKIVRFAFEYARTEGRKKIHCATKANIMKFTEGMLKKVFEEVSKEYPEIEAHHIIIDNCAHQLVKKPEQFDVIVTTNMNGDIMSDLTSALVGGLGFAPSANIGHAAAIFEAVHGSAPKYAGKDSINPTAAILSGVMMLKYLEEYEAAARIEEALRLTWENTNTQTRDIAGDAKAIGTQAFTAKVIENLSKVVKRQHKNSGKVDTTQIMKKLSPPFAGHSKVEGVDVFVEFAGSPRDIGTMIEKAGDQTALKLKMISNRGTKVFPGETETSCVNHWRCRFMNRNGAEISDRQIYELLFNISEMKMKWMHIEKLQMIDGKAGFSQAQGED
jgi:isocitrate dehydrogenase